MKGCLIVLHQSRIGRSQKKKEYHLRGFASLYSFSATIFEAAFSEETVL